MLYRRFLIVAVVLIAAASFAQTASRTRPSTPVRPIGVRVRVFDVAVHRPLNLQLNARLLDAYGGLIDDKVTDGSGTAQFRAVMPGSYQIEVVGSELRERTLVQFDISENEAMHTEIVQVHLAEINGTANSPGGMVSSSQLQVPEEAAKHYKKGAEALRHNNWIEAEKYFNDAINVYPQFDQAYNSLGVACERAGDRDCAVRALTQAIEINRHNADAHRNLSRIFISTHRYADANEMLKRLLTFEPLDAWALTSAAYVEFELGDDAQALMHASKAHQVPHQGLPNAHLILARIYERQKKPSEATAEYEQFLKESPNGPNAERAREGIARLSGTPENPR